MRYEPFSERHLPAVASVVHDPEVLRFTRIPDPPPEGFARAWLERYEAGRAEGAREAFAVLDDDDETFLGLALAPTLDREEGEAELGYLVAPAARGRGVATEMLRWLTAWLFERHPEIVRAYLVVEVGNGASQRVAERAGYVREGVMRSVHVKQGRRADCILYSRLASDA